ncbi:hypothetical protein [Fibrobacter sp. UWR2]|uniref:hypothetical protein n=1 Tax=Fibrobacter sp. UWR2 TaxID=1964352 RepID=UPI001E58EF12|nr:hypothetical protein [Fibrobacter sp. UWR2]
MAEDILADIRIPISAVPNPYKDAPPCRLNLLELARYAERVGKKIEELTAEEILQFKL